MKKRSIIGAVALAATTIAISSIVSDEVSNIIIAAAIIIPIFFILGTANPRVSYREIIFVIAVVSMNFLSSLFAVNIFGLCMGALALLGLYFSMARRIS